MALNCYHLHIYDVILLQFMSLFTELFVFHLNFNTGRYEVLISITIRISYIKSWREWCMYGY